MKGYREVFFSKYNSAFNKLSLRRDGYTREGYAFADAKFIPLIQGWCQHLDRSEPCVDLGCGDGSVLHALQTLGFQHLFGVDVSEEQIVIARNVAPSVVKGDLFEYLETFPDSYFVLITLFDVIEHLTKDEIMKCVTLIHQKLKPGGVWICHLPNGDSPGVGTVQFGDFTHETILSPRSAENICTLFGFTNFAAAEHFGASSGLKGTLRRLAWKVIRGMFAAWSLVETGTAGSGIYTRNFAFRAVKPLPSTMSGTGAIQG